MDNGASSYRRFLDGDDNGFVEIVRDYKDGLILFLDSFVRNLSIAEDLAEDTFVKLGIKKPRSSGKSSKSLIDGGLTTGAGRYKGLANGGEERSIVNGTSIS